MRSSEAYRRCRSWEVTQMTDLISRADAIEAVASADETNGNIKVFSGLAIIDILKALPSADAEQGEWIDEDGNKVPLDKDGRPLGSCWCNQCHEWLVGSDEYAIKGNFCPNCGARMEAGVKNI